MDDILELLHLARISTFNVPVIDDDGVEITRLNGNLIAEQNISERDVGRLCRSHVLLHATLKEMETATLKDDIRRLANRVTRIEFIQQRLWGFKPDSTHHNWYTVPHCTCPKRDNAERKGTKYQIRDLSCIVHGE